MLQPLRALMMAAKLSPTEESLAGAASAQEPLDERRADRAWADGDDAHAPRLASQRLTLARSLSLLLVFILATQSVLLASAVNDALSPLGLTMHELPMRMHKLEALINEAIT